MNEQDYRDLFLKQSNCFADMFKVKVDGEELVEEFDAVPAITVDAVPAITVDVFIDIIKGLKLIKDHSNCKHNFPYYDDSTGRHYIKCTKCGKEVSTIDVF